MQSFLEYVDHWADTTPNAPAWWTVDITTNDSPELVPISWYALRLLVHQTICRFRELDFQPESRIITCDRNSLDWVLVDLACQALGHVHIPIDYRLSDFTKRDICRRVAPAHYVLLRNKQAFSFLETSSSTLISQNPSIQTSIQAPASENLTTTLQLDTQLGQQLLKVASRGDPHRVATILFTSGSTSSPKGVQLTLGNLLRNAFAKLEAMPQGNTDRRLNILPFSHAYARTCELSTWLLSGSSILAADSIDHAINLAPLYKPSLINGVPYVFQKIQAIVEKNKSLHLSANSSEAKITSEANKRHLLLLLGTKIRMLAAGGAGLAEETYQWFHDCSYPIYQGYGLTEAGPVICSNRYPNPSPNHVGWPVLDTAVRIDEQQMLWAKGPGIMSGYYDNVQATDDSIRDGWLATGDLAEWAEGGAVRILGRADDRITLSTGYNVDPIGLERKIAKAIEIDRCLIATCDRKDLVLIIASSESIPIATKLDRPSILSTIRDALKDEPEYAIPKEVVWTDDSWTQENGLLNSKGLLERRRIAERYLGQRQEPCENHLGGTI